ncbi:DinB family protein [Flavobacterium sp. 1]|uniref:DinB family protein n=1 Tax=Flavobacterium sp. 1 TaxID=2035200 RepID=UPI000C234571|nr:DinB family protein [Flavobacterium sp. 1]PJJ07861.1 DinB family protein [Flavobacterium sp. 1]
MKTTETIIKMIFDRWNASIASCDTLLNSLTDETLQKEIAPGKNRGIYLLGHLIAVHDDMLILLDMGEKLYPELNEPFLKSPDKTTTLIQSASELRTFWSNQCEVLKQKFDNLKPEGWFEKHTAVSTEDFAKEPHRNKLNIIITRTSHLQYHLGQLQLLK